MHDEKGGGVAWLALILAGVSLWLSWTAYNRTSDIKLEDQIREAIEETGLIEKSEKEKKEMATSTDGEIGTTTATTTEEEA